MVCMKAIADTEFKELTDEQWKEISKVLPPRGRKGRPRANDRRTLNAILFVIKAHVPWNYLPKEFGDDSTANRRLRSWERKGIWQNVVGRLQALGYIASPNAERLGEEVYGQAERTPLIRLTLRRSKPT
jgi:transposase